MKDGFPPIKLSKGGTGFSTQINGIAYINEQEPRQVCIEFENKVHQTLLSILNVSNVATEKDIINKFGPSCTEINHMFDVFGSNITICIQSKCEKTKESLDYIHNFIKCVETVQKITGRNIQGILLSPLTDNSSHTFAIINTTNPFIRLISIHLDPTDLIKHNQEELQDLLIEKMLVFLHINYGIWAYDSDGSVIMR